MDHDDSSRDSGPAEMDSSTHPIRADWREHDSPRSAIIETVIAATGRDPQDLPPLSESVDTDGLDALLAGSNGMDGGARVSFAFAGVDVAIRNDGELEVRTDEANPEAVDASPRTDSELNAQLERLLNEAYRNGVSICGGWAVRNGTALPDWDIHVTRVTKPRGRDSRTRLASTDRTARRRS